MITSLKKEIRASNGFSGWLKKCMGDLAAQPVSNRSTSNVGYLSSIDFLRGVASLAVVMHHASEGASHKTTNGLIAGINEAFGFGALGVPLFFVLSGFCIHRKQAERSAAGLDNSVPFRKYWKRRFFRLYPSYFTTCVCSAILMAIAIGAGIQSAIANSYGSNQYLYLAFDFLTHILLIHSFFPIFDKGLGNGPLWTLAREEQYYLLYFPLMKIARHVNIWTCLLIAMIASYLALFLSNSISDTYPGLAYVSSTSCFAFWPQWVLGMISMYLLVSRRQSIAWLGNRFTPIAGIAIVIWQKLMPGSDWFQNLMYGAGFFLVISSFSLIELKGRWSRANFVRGLETIGRYSYSLYLVHYPILIVLSKFGRQFGSSENLPAYMAFMTLSILICHVFALVLYLLVERHGQTKPVES